MKAPTPEETEQRLRELGELYRFSMALLEAQAPVWTDVQLTRKALTVTPAEPTTALTAQENERIFLAAPSSRQHFVGDEYSCWFSPGNPLAATGVRAILVGVARLPVDQNWVSRHPRIYDAASKHAGLNEILKAIKNGVVITRSMLGK